MRLDIFRLTRESLQPACAIVDQRRRRPPRAENIAGVHSIKRRGPEIDVAPLTSGQQYKQSNLDDWEPFPQRSTHRYLRRLRLPLPNRRGFL